MYLLPLRGIRERREEKNDGVYYYVWTISSFPMVLKSNEVIMSEGKKQLNRAASIFLHGDESKKGEFFPFAAASGYLFNCDLKTPGLVVTS